MHQLVYPWLMFLVSAGGNPPTAALSWWSAWLLLCSNGATKVCIVTSLHHFMPVDSQGLMSQLWCFYQMTSIQVMQSFTQWKDGHHHKVQGEAAGWTAQKPFWEALGLPMGEAVWVHLHKHNSWLFPCSFVFLSYFDNTALHKKNT